MSSASLRPSVVHGAYPERAPTSHAGLDRLAQAIARLAPSPRLRSARLRAMAARVGQERDAARDLTDRVLNERVAELRRTLHRDANDAVAEQAFGLVSEVARRSLGMTPFDTQLIGGWVMWRGMLAEMATGEGKTLTATLPACVAALSGIPVHVVSVNDYLVERDAETMAPLYEALGLSVGTVTAQLGEARARRAAYACDVTYVSSKELVFDYLRDRAALERAGGARSGSQRRLRQSDLDRAGLVMRGLCFAVIDEADSVLIDEARTPVILSRVEGADEDERVYRQALLWSSRLDDGRDFVLDRRERSVQLTQAGCERARELTEPAGGVWARERRRLELLRHALSARLLFERDAQYLVHEGRIEIIDPNTGRRMPDRTWQAGLHQMIEAKEGCEISPRRSTLARITTQRFYARYLRLAGMSGTAREVAPELRAVYGLRTIPVPTHRPTRRRHLGERCHATADARLDAVVARVEGLHAEGRPVLLGTRSVAASEQLSARLREHGLEHALLNAREHRAEAEVIAGAGERGRITVATNMAGRGADIRLGPDVEGLGGLHVIAIERSEARRIDRQLYGRCGRQGDPGSVELATSLDDELALQGLPDAARAALARALGRGLPGAEVLSRSLMAMIQRIVEGRHASGRRELMQREDQLARALAFAGPGE